MRVADFLRSRGVFSLKIVPQVEMVTRPHREPTPDPCPP